MQPQTDHVVLGPFGNKLAVSTLLAPFGGVDHQRVVANGFDFTEVANNRRVLRLTFQHVVGHHQQPLDVELPKEFLELGPFFIHHPPHKA